MVDITLCTSTECPVKRSCYRANASPDLAHQGYSNFEYTCNENNGFTYYIQLTLNDLKTNKKGEKK